MVAYINHMVWRFIKHQPNQFKLLDVRYNIMKVLILGDWVHLIKFILFGDEDDENENDCKEKKEEKRFEIRHVPRNIFWPGEINLQKDGIELKTKIIWN